MPSCSMGVEARFFIPWLTRAGERHRPSTVEWLEREVLNLFGGLTGPVYFLRLREPHQGGYIDSAGQLHQELSVEYVVALPVERLAWLRALLEQAAHSDWFDQECIYLSLGGEVELISPIPAAS